MLVSERTALKKAPKLRHAEYYDLITTFDNLYKASTEGKTFTDLMDIIRSEENIMLAFRNIKRNTGSLTSGVDGRHIGDLEKLNSKEFCELVKKKLRWYKPQAVKRVEIPKPNGKMRPLGIPTILDRVIQQCVLQVMEPICEAKFHERSNGFRPNRSVENAISQSYFLTQVCHLHYVVDVDIKGFFDNVNHTKLIQQIWAMGIQDKQLICIVKAMLKAPIMFPDGKCCLPDKGTPQGGILSPLLSNIALNELDWWVDSQWINFPAQKDYKSFINRNGSEQQGGKYRALKETNLKEMYLVRYADDFKIFCRDRDAADKTFHAVTLWLRDRLKLEVSLDKSKVTNLRKQYTEFLGFKIRLKPKGHKWVVQSKVCERAKITVAKNLRNMLDNIRHVETHEAYCLISRYNSIVMGAQNFYCIATDVSLDFGDISHQVINKMKRTFPRELKRKGLPMSRYMQKRYGESKMVRYIRGLALAPISYVRTKHPMHKPRQVNKYTPQGRKAIHKTLKVNTAILHRLMRSIDPHQSIEYSDNRLSLYAAQHGKCAVTGRILDYDEIHCHHKTPKELGGNDRYNNLIIVHKAVHKLIHCTQENTIQLYMELIKPNSTALMKMNQLRKKCGNEPILA